jgi:AbrB family looped-hinge helix DNA binding protein
MVTSITSKGQVTIPAYIREELALMPYDKVYFSIDEDKAIIKKAVDFFSMGGSVKTNKKFNIKAMTKTAQKYVGARYLKRSHGKDN